MRRLAFLSFLLVVLLTVGCSGGSEPVNDTAVANAPTVAPLFGRVGDSGTDEQTDTVEDTAPTDLVEDNNSFTILVDAQQNMHPISPLIYGVSGADSEALVALQPTINSWGGNPSTRYNWELGNAWNAGADWEYRNGNYGFTGESGQR